MVGGLVDDASGDGVAAAHEDELTCLADSIEAVEAERVFHFHGQLGDLGVGEFGGLVCEDIEA